MHGVSRAAGRSGVVWLVMLLVLVPGLGAILMTAVIGTETAGAILVPIALVVASAVAAAALLQRRIASPLATLAEALDGVAAGDPGARLVLPQSPDFARAAGSFNRMAAMVTESTSRLEHEAFHDTLTALPNRAGFMKRFSTALTQAQQDGSTVAVLFMDVDRFKNLNDSLGHGIGDQLLSILGRRLKASASEHTVSRLGGDEFTILVESHRAESEALKVADQVLRSLQWPIAVSGRELFVSVSIGIAVSTPEDLTITNLLRKADIALYRSKSAGRGRYTLFHPDLDELSAEQFALDNALRRSVQRDELILHFQPIVNLETREISGMEALLRWNHPHRGILPPATFISIAEETGDIVRIGHWVLERACREAVRLQRVRPEAPLNLCVNLSAAEFRQPDLPLRLAEVLRQTGMPPGLLELELTETVLLDHVTESLPVLQAIKAMGVRLAIDDFGTGYSSLSYLEHLPVDTLKIDRSFIARLGVEKTTAPVVRAVVELGRTLGVEIVAEGVETEPQVRFLAQAGCGYGQGFYFREAVPADEFAILLRNQARSLVPMRRRGLRKVI